MDQQLIDQILGSVVISLSGSDISRTTWNQTIIDIYRLCNSGYPGACRELYRRTKQLIESRVIHIYEEITSGSKPQQLQLYEENWNIFKNASDHIDLLYSHLNNYVESSNDFEGMLCCSGSASGNNNKLLLMGELALNLWRQTIVEPLKLSLVQQILKEIDSDRTVGTVSQTNLLNVVMSFVEMEKYNSKNPLEFYEQTFETVYLDRTGDYYQNEADRLLMTCEMSEYIERVLHILDNEEMRSRKFLHPTSYNKVTRECRQKLAVDHLVSLKDCCRNIVRNESRSDMSNIYQLLKPIPEGLEMLIGEVQEHIKQTGLQAVSNISPDKLQTDFVEIVLDIHGKYMELIRAIFNGDQVFVSALHKACNSIVNDRNSNSKTMCRSPELLARYCDTFLKKKCTKFESETVIEDKLSNSISVLKYLEDKDLFSWFYRKMLAKRLIYSQSESLDLEEEMTKRLQQVIGYDLTFKVLQMLTDVKISKDLNTDFSCSLKEKTIHMTTDFKVSVLRSGAWPVKLSGSYSIALTPDMEKYFRHFELFYQYKFNGRKLTWLHSLSYGEVKLTYTNKPYLITMGTIILSLLLTFENTDALTYGELYTYMQLPDDELKRNLRQLVDAKLLCTEGEIKAESRFSLHLNYSNKRTKFKLLSTQKEPTKEIDEIPKAVDEDRKFFVEAAIVRIMKARQSLRHKQLVQEVLSQARSRCAPSIGLIKKCIESLIEKDFIERTNGAMDNYSYIS